MDLASKGARTPPKTFLIRFDDETTARLNAWAAESGVNATLLIRQIVKDVLADDARCEGEDCDLPKLAVEAQLIFAERAWRRGFNLAKIARTLKVEEAAVGLALTLIKEGQTE